MTPEMILILIPLILMITVTEQRIAVRIDKQRKMTFYKIQRIKTQHCLLTKCEMRLCMERELRVRVQVCAILSLHLCTIFVICMEQAVVLLPRWRVDGRQGWWLQGPPLDLDKLHTGIQSGQSTVGTLYKRWLDCHHVPGSGVDGGSQCYSENVRLWQK